MLVGVNGVGKTTTVGKLANYFISKKKSVTVAAADTFRAAAADQLTVWADRAKVRIVKHEEGSDSLSLSFSFLASARSSSTISSAVVTEMSAPIKISSSSSSAVIMLVGVNGVGKTTTVGKLANYFISKKKSVKRAFYF